jgi:hypothetical protein
MGAMGNFHVLHQQETAVSCSHNSLNKQHSLTGFKKMKTSAGTTNWKFKTASLQWTLKKTAQSEMPVLQFHSQNTN